MHHECFVEARAIQLFRFRVLNANLTCLRDAGQKLVRGMRCKNHALLCARLVAINGMHVAVKRRESRVRQPSFVKMQDVDLAVELLLDHFVVVDDAVVRRLRDRHDARLGTLIFDQRILGNLFLNRFPIKFGTRDRADDSVMVARGHQEDGNGPRQSNSVQNRLVAVTIHNHDVSGSHRVVPNNLIGRGRTVRHKEKIVTTEDASRILFGLCHRTSVIQQLAQFFHGVADVGAKHVFAEELVEHLSDRTL